MSLINKALQDLEQRQAGGLEGESPSDEIRAVPRGASRGKSAPVVGGAAVLAVAALVGWYFTRDAAAPQQLAAAQPKPAAPAPVAAPAPAVAKAPEAASAASATPAPAPAAAVAAASAPAAVQVAQNTASSKTAPAPAVAAPASSAAAAAPAKAQVAAAPASATKPAATVIAAAEPAKAAPKSETPQPAPTKPAAEPKPQATPPTQVATAAPARAQAGEGVVVREPRGAAKVEAPGVVKTPIGSGAAEQRATSSPQLEKTVRPEQQSDNLYKQAMLLMQQGHTIEARPLLRRALDINPANAAARQALANVLIEGNGINEAIALLRDGTRITPQRSSLWSSLARLEIEQGNTAAAVATLEQGLPAAGDDAQYNAFYAVMLQRAGKHEDAVKYYLNALRSDPAMPNWLIGVGISLQALGKSSDALEAFTRARDGGRLQGQLLSFVEQRIEQLKSGG